MFGQTFQRMLKKPQLVTFKHQTWIVAPEIGQYPVEKSNYV